MPMIDLHQDVLWRIFLMNSDLDGMIDLGSLYEPGKEPPRYRYSPLTVTRRTSQVCRLWRHLILGSSSIWGRVIHLDFLNQEKDDWRNEVLRRTGEASLCIKGDVMGYVTEDFFLSLLETEWSRIRRLDVRIHNEWEFEDETWEPLLRPTTTLESFNLNYSYNNSRILSGSKGKLFANKAPSLREFHSTGIFFSLHAPWIFQLRHITFSSPLTIPKILEGLKEMNSLESVQIDPGIYPHQASTDPLPHLSLPRLQNITVSGFLATCSQFLESITPALGCGLCLTTTNTRSITSIEELDTAHKVFTRYSHNYFVRYNPKRLLLSLKPTSFYVYDLLDPIRVPSSPTFQFMIQSGHRLPRLAIPPFLKSLVVSPMKNVTFLELLLSSDGVEPSDPEFLKLIRSLSSLQTLQITSVDTLDVLRHIPTTQKTPLPSLRTLKIVQSTKLPEDSIRLFLRWRRNVGLAIKFLDLSFCSTDLLGDLRFLDTFGGLKVRWSGQHTISEYLCGSGSSERLNFVSRHFNWSTHSESPVIYLDHPTVAHSGFRPC